MIRRYKALFTAAIITVISGCQSLGPINTEPHEHLRSGIAIPHLMPGQPAVIRYKTLVPSDLPSGKFKRIPFNDVWDSTGLFSSVEITSSTEPTSQGVYINSQCDMTHIGAQPITFILSMFSLFTIPTLYNETVTCNTDIYQDGVLLTNDKVKFKHYYLSGWLAIFFAQSNEEITDFNRRTFSGTVVNSALSKLSMNQ